MSAVISVAPSLPNGAAPDAATGVSDCSSVRPLMRTDCLSMATSRIGDSPPFCHGGFICIGRTTRLSVPSIRVFPVLCRR